MRCLRMKVARNVTRNIIVAALAAILLFPLILLLLFSILDGETMEQLLASFGSRFADSAPFRWKVDVSSYVHVAAESRKFAAALLNSFQYSLITTFGQLLLALPAAIALSVFKVKGRRLIVTMYMILMMMPFQVTMVPTFLTLYYLDLLDSPWAIILPQWFVPFSVILLYLYMIRIPSELHEAAQVDGAGTVRLIRHIVIPLVKHGLWSVGLLHFIDSWNMIEQPIVFLSSMERMPLSIFIRQSLERNAAEMFVPAVLFVLPILIIYGMYHRSIISGLLISFTGGGGTVSGQSPDHGVQGFSGWGMPKREVDVHTRLGVPCDGVHGPSRSALEEGARR